MFTIMKLLEIRTFALTSRLVNVYALLLLNVVCKDAKILPQERVCTPTCVWESLNTARLG